jgi:hypothetical protein
MELVDFRLEDSIKGLKLELDFVPSSWGAFLLSFYLVEDIEKEKFFRSLKHHLHVCFYCTRICFANPEFGVH